MCMTNCLSVKGADYISFLGWAIGLVLESGAVDGLIDLVDTLRCVAGGGSLCRRKKEGKSPQEEQQLLSLFFWLQIERLSNRKKYS